MGEDGWRANTLIDVAPTVLPLPAGGIELWSHRAIEGGHSEIDPAKCGQTLGAEARLAGQGRSVGQAGSHRPRGQEGWLVLHNWKIPHHRGSQTQIHCARLHQQLAQAICEPLQERASGEAFMTGPCDCHATAMLRQGALPCLGRTQSLAP